MLFYPDQYFYQNLQRPSSNRGSDSRSSRRSASRHHESGPQTFWDDLFYGVQPQQPPSPPTQRRASYVPDEYVVVDPDELAALRAYRESRRRQQEHAERRDAILARKRMENERKARELAREQAEARMRARVEANARAAAREYFRRKQAQQIALQQAQQEERQRRQQIMLEQLRKQFGLFNFPGQSACETEAEDAQDAPTQASAQENAQREHSEQAVRAESEESQKSEEPETHHTKEGDKVSESRHEVPIFDPIRSLIEALAPYPFVYVSESSDEEEDPSSSREDDKKPRAEPEDIQESDEDEEGEGPTCETASELSEDGSVEVVDPLAQPPYSEFHDFSADDEEDEEERASRKDRSHERQSKVPRDRKKQKHNERHKSKQAAKEAAVTSPEISGLLYAYEDELKRLSEGYDRIYNMPAPGDLKQAISRVEGIKIGYRRAEEMYNKLDQIRVSKDLRKLKHNVTTESVALADKFDELLQSANEIKQQLQAQTKTAAAPKASNSRSGSPKHQVTMEEIQDESE